MIITFTKEIAWQKYFNKIYIFNDVERNTFILEDIAVIIWDYINVGYEYEKILSELKSKYNEINISELKKDLDMFLDEMRENRLVEW